MKHLHYISSLFLLTISILSCHQMQRQEKNFRNDFTAGEQKTLEAAKAIISRAYFGTLITLNEKGEAKARLMEPFAPEEHFVIYLATNPKSRKVKEIKRNHQATLHYIDEPRTGYVSFYGKIYIVENDSIKKVHWKKGWEQFYQNKTDAYMLLKFIPDYMELISIRDSLTGNPENWQPARVNLRD